MNMVFFILLLISMLGVVACLVAGLFVMAKDGEINRKYSNRLMQARIWMQALALAFFILCVITSRHS